VAPKGAVVEVYGPEASGKTTLALHMVAQAQKKGDSQPTSMPACPGFRLAQKRLGVDIDNLSSASPIVASSAGNLRSTGAQRRPGYHRHRFPWPALVPKAEIDGEMGDSHVGLQARLMSQALRKMDRHHQQDQQLRRLHNQIRMEDRRDVRQPRDPPPAATP